MSLFAKLVWPLLILYCFISVIIGPISLCSRLQTQTWVILGSILVEGDIARLIHCESKKNCATFIFTVTLANVGRFLKFFQCRNQKEMAHNMNEKFPNVA